MPNNVYLIFCFYLLQNGNGAYWLNKHFRKCYIENAAYEPQENNSVESCDFIDVYATNHSNLVDTYNMSTVAVNKIFIGNVKTKQFCSFQQLTNIINCLAEL